MIVLLESFFSAAYGAAHRYTLRTHPRNDLMAIHPLAVVDPQAEVHPDASIGPFCCLRGAVVIEAGAELRNHVTVYGRATIGRGSVLFPNSVVASDPQDLKFRGEDSAVRIGA